MVHELRGVGQNLQDHLGVVSQFACTQPVTLHRSAVWWRTQLAGIQYLFFGKGDASFPPTAAGAFFKSSSEKAVCDMQIHYVSVAVPDVHGRADIPTSHGFSSIVYGCRPESRGHLTLKTAALMTLRRSIRIISLPSKILSIFVMAIASPVIFSCKKPLTLIAANR